MAEFSDEIKNLAAKLESYLDRTVSRKVSNRGPKFVLSAEPSGGDDLASTVSSLLEARVYRDGTNTLVELVDSADNDYVLATGKARRRKGDPRDPELGAYIALARAFSEMSDRYAEYAASRMR